jgi:hypothetical protein
MLVKEAELCSSRKRSYARQGCGGMLGKEAEACSARLRGHFLLKACQSVPFYIITGMFYPCHAELVSASPDCDTVCHVGAYPCGRPFYAP